MNPDPYEYEGKGGLTAQFQDLHAISDSFDICKFNAFAEGIEEYVLQYNGMTGRDVTEDELLEAGERIYNLERYYNNLVASTGWTTRYRSASSRTASRVRALRRASTANSTR